MSNETIAFALLTVLYILAMLGWANEARRRSNNERFLRQSREMSEDLLETIINQRQFYGELLAEMRKKAN